MADTPQRQPGASYRTHMLRARVTAAGYAEAMRLAALHGHPDLSAYLRALVAADSRKHPAAERNTP